MSELTDRMRADLLALYELEAPVRDFVHQTPAWSQRGVGEVFTGAHEGAWGCSDGRIRKAFRVHEPDEAMLAAQEKIAGWLATCRKRFAMPPLAERVREGFERLPEGQKRALMDHCVKRWIEQRRVLPVIPPMPEGFDAPGPQHEAAEVEEVF